MQAALAQRVDGFVECGWEPQTTTEITTSLVGRRPFNWWLFLLVSFFFPLFGGIVYLTFWLSSSRATVFLHQEGDEMVAVGDLWLVQLQEGRREAHIEEQRQIKERGFLAVMWPQVLGPLVLLSLWIGLARWYF